MDSKVCCLLRLPMYECLWRSAELPRRALSHRSNMHERASSRSCLKCHELKLRAVEYDSSLIVNRETDSLNEICNLQNAAWSLYCNNKNIIMSDHEGKSFLHLYMLSESLQTVSLNRHRVLISWYEEHHEKGRGFDSFTWSFSLFEHCLAIATCRPRQHSSAVSVLQSCQGNKVYRH